VFLPLRRIGLPVMSAFFLAFFVIRMVPGLIDESRLILMAQRSRGVGVRAGWFRSWRSTASLVVPIFASALRRSDQMALALASRGFNENHVPLPVRRLQLGAFDFVMLGALIAGWVVWVYIQFR
jgi:energy-coupling factor transport system permease protein